MSIKPSMHAIWRVGLVCLLAFAAGCSPAAGSPDYTPLPPVELPAAPPPPWSATPVPDPNLGADNLHMGALGSLPEGMSVEEWVDAVLANMAPKQKVSQMLITGVDGSELNKKNCEFVQQMLPGGVTFQHGNIPDPEALREFIHGLQDCALEVQPVPLLMTLAHEGQYINRYEAGATEFPMALAQGATADPQVAYHVAFAAGRELAYSGVNMILGPVADVLRDYENKIIADRIYGDDPELVAQYVAYAVAGYRDAGVIPVLKHFPGHGGVPEDSHLELPVDEASAAALQQFYIPPFEAGVGAGAPALMLSHVAYPTLSGDQEPATLSTAVIDFARAQMGEDVVLVSDSMRMKAVTAGKELRVDEVSLRAVQAGMDMLLLNSPDQTRMAQKALMDAYRAGELSDERIEDAARRILTMKARWGLAQLPGDQLPAPDWEADNRLAQAVGKYSVALIKNDANLIPIREEMKRVLVIAPRSEWSMYPELETALSAQGHTVDLVTFSPPWDGPVQETPELAEIPQRAANYDLTLVFTWQAYLNRLEFDDPWQSNLVTSLLDQQIPVIVIAIRSPTDIRDFPQVPAYLALYGSTQGQVDALIATLLGEWHPTGSNPLPDFSP